MIASGALVLFKNRPALVRRDGDRLELTFADKSCTRVREKDVEMLHIGPLASIPAEHGKSGDFETAWEMTAGGTVELADLAELVYGENSPSAVLSTRLAVQNGDLFYIDDSGRIHARSPSEREELELKRRRKENEAGEKSAFIARAKKNLVQAGDERFYGEIEAFALGKTQKSKIAAEAGLGETMESAHAWLLRAGIWKPSLNPYPSRADHPSKAPELELAADDDAGRVDLTHMPAWAIDNAWSHDPDDAVSFADDTVWVHIADPAAVITPGSDADLEAANRGCTLYLPEGTIPMLPDAALDRCGLGLSELSRALSFKITLDDEGLVAGAEIVPSFVKVMRRSYESVDAELDSGPLARLMLIADKRLAYRRKNGAVDIEIPELHIWAKDGVPELQLINRTRAGALVREMMVMTGEAAARWAFERSLPFPFYSQEAPGNRENLPDGLAGEFAKRRLMRAGMAGVQPRAHQGLGITMYAQASSPLRRYADLLAHQQIRAVLAGTPPLPADELSMRLAKAAAQGQAARKAERASDLHWVIVWLLEHPDWEGDGTVVQAGTDSTVYIPELGQETRVKLPSLELNDTVRLRFLKADVARAEIIFSAL